MKSIPAIRGKSECVTWLLWWLWNPFPYNKIFSYFLFVPIYEISDLFSSHEITRAIRFGLQNYLDKALVLLGKQGTNASIMRGSLSTASEKSENEIMPYLSLSILRETFLSNPDNNQWKYHQHIWNAVQPWLLPHSPPPDCHSWPCSSSSWSSSPPWWWSRHHSGRKCWNSIWFALAQYLLE